MSLRDTSIVDELILDYLLHNCISALLLEWDVRHAENLEEGLPRGDARVLAEAEVAQKADRSLLLVNSFLQTYQQLHPSGVRPLHRDVRFRLILCRFVSLLLRRIDPASSFARKSQTTVLRLRKQKNIRLRRYFRCRGVTHVFPDEDFLGKFLLAEHKVAPEHLLLYCIQRFGADDDVDEEEGYNQEEQQGHITRSSTISAGSICGTASLSDAVPLFMLLSAWTSTVVLGSPVSTLWMGIAASFMAHAFAEDYLCHGVPPFQALCENFAWGVVSLNGDEKEEIPDTMEDIVVNEMFGADEGDVSKSWEEVRKEVLKEIVPPNGVGLESHLVGRVLAKGNGKGCDKEASDSENAQLVGSFRDLEKNLVEGLVMAMVRAVEKPVLTQLEQGRLDGVEDGDVEGLLARAGIARET
ncbi:hypothetical protein L211DRAFT_840702 [Terfezia boudieri ATCC MYA-4762]|uniref:Uncharacterized protein n=1 Tax=Terfezia boudieri ATCC MYA-4762 TaxID=1051890 RepID=A0A3N4LF45_9PEZI|nr:hypothetical protein L211DRAFT_840702 [Terfezia boudieri ATCC MYA-4762]